MFNLANFKTMFYLGRALLQLLVLGQHLAFESCGLFCYKD